MSWAKSCSFCPYPNPLEIFSRLEEGRIKEEWNKSSLRCLWKVPLCPVPRPALGDNAQRVWGSERKANQWLASQVGKLPEVLYTPTGYTQRCLCVKDGRPKAASLILGTHQGATGLLAKSSSDVALATSRSGLAVRARSHQPQSG